MPDYTFSFSQFRACSQCPAAWHAHKVRGVWQPEPTEAMALGLLLEARLLPPNYTEAVVKDNPALRTAKGLSAKAQRTLAAAEYALTLPNVQALLAGAEFQVPWTMDLGGITWRGRIDILDRTAGMVTDAKLVGKGVNSKEWDARLRAHVHWSQSGLYWWQLGLYREAARRMGIDNAAVALLAISPNDTQHEVRIIEPAMDAYQWIDGLLASMMGAVNHTWTSPITGLEIPPIIEMLGDSVGDTIPGCGDCAWCHRINAGAIETFRPVEGRQENWRM